MKKRAPKIVATALVAGMGTMGVSPAYASDREVVEALYNKVLSGTSSPDLPVQIEEILAPDWQSIGDYSSPVKTRDQFLMQLQGIGKTLPDLTWHIEEILQEGNRFIVRGRATATPTGIFMGIEPSGRAFEIMAIDIHTVEHHKIVLSYHVEDWHQAIEQLKTH